MSARKAFSQRTMQEEESSSEAATGPSSEPGSSSGSSTASSGMSPARLTSENERRPQQQHQRHYGGSDREPLLDEEDRLRQRTPWGDHGQQDFPGPVKVDPHNRCCDAKYWCIKVRP